jgi:prepilin-type N-terminal cleavage/methylation domain-containing protein
MPGRLPAGALRAARLRGSASGFTLVEMSVVITILVVLASMVAPKVFTMLDTRKIITFVNGLPGIAMEARLAAIKQNQTAKLEYDAGQNRLTVTVSQANADDQQVDYLPVPKFVTVDEFQVAGQPSSASGWTVDFYPDGTSNGGALQTNDKGIIRSLVIDKTGISRAILGPMPDTSQDSWAAGTYDVRTN